MIDLISASHNGRYVAFLEHCVKMIANQMHYQYQVFKACTP
jgi:hypothetical protein